MKCNGCSTPMLLDKSETGDRSSIHWHRCPLCGKVRLTSQLDRLHDHQQQDEDANEDAVILTPGSPVYA